MEKTRVFLASSINEFRNERLKIGAFIQDINEKLIGKGRYIDLEVCEEYTNAVSLQGKQNDYNDDIRRCDYFIGLFGDRVGEYTLQEYEVASEQYRKSAQPRITILLKGREMKIQENLISLQERLKQENTSTLIFSSFDGIRRQIEAIIQDVNEKSINTESTHESLTIVTILVALSVSDLEMETAELKDYIRNLNDTYIDHNLFFNIQFCDNSSSSLIDQMERQVENSSFFYVIIGSQASKAVFESFDLAYSQFLKEKKPRIYTYFQILPNESDVSKEVKDFMNKLGNEIAHYYSRFTHLDSIKLNMLLELTRASDLKDIVAVNDGKALLDGKEVLSLENIPVFRNNEQRTRYREELKELREKKAKLAVEYANDPDNMDLYQQLSETAGKYREMQDSYHEMEKAILSIYSDVAERNSSGEPVTWREKKASEYIDAGDYKAALAVLSDPEREEELRRAYEKGDTVMDEFISYIKEGELKIKTLKAQGINSGTLPEITKEYENCVRVAKDRLIKTEIIYDYVDFLFHQSEYGKAIENGEWLSRYYDFKAAEKNESQGDLYYLLSALYDENNNTKKAVECAVKSANIYVDIFERNPEKHKDTFCIIFNRIGFLFMKINNYKKAEDTFLLSMKTKEEYGEAEKMNTDMTLANTYSGLSKVYEKSNYKKAEEFLLKAIGIGETAAKANPAEYEHSLSVLYNGLAILYSDHDRAQEAEQYYLKALEIDKKHYNDNPAAYENALGIEFINLGTYYEEIGQFEKSEKYYTDAIRLYEKLNKINPAAYKPNLASVYNNIAGLYAKIGSQEKEAWYAGKAVDLFKEVLYSGKMPDTNYHSSLSTAYNTLAKSYMKTGEKEKAVTALRDSLDEILFLYNESPEAHAKDAADAYSELGMNIINDDLSEAESNLKKAREIYGNLYQNDPQSVSNRLAQTYELLCPAYYRDGKDDICEENCLKAIEIREEAARSGYLKKNEEAVCATINYILGAVYLRSNRIPDAIRYVQKAVEIDEKLLQDGVIDTKTLINLYDLLAQLYADNGNEAEAQKCRDRSRMLKQ